MLLVSKGKLDELNARFAERVKAKVMRPTPVAGMVAATESRTWEYDPTITLESDIRDAKGNLIAVAGQRINPLDKITMSEKLLFIDGDDIETSFLTWSEVLHGYLEYRSDILSMNSGFSFISTR